MVELSFQIESVAPIAHAASPQLAFRVAITEAVATPIQSVLLKCQIRIEPARRRYSEENHERLLDIFGPPDQWGKTMHSMLWTHAQEFVPAFTHGATIDLAVPCTFDFNVTATKYFAAMEEGHIPLCFLFSGMVFYQAGDDGLQVAPIALDKQANYRLPIHVWKQMMDRYYPHSTWLSLDRDVFELLLGYKVRCGLATWEQAIESLLARESQQVTS